MPIFDTVQPEKAPQNPATGIQEPTFKHSIVDSQVTPIETLISYVGGSNWPVDYYQQVYGQDEELKPFDPNQLVAYQQYHKVNRLILKLQGALSTDDDHSNGRMNSTGEAIITALPGFIPNVHDAFIADIGEGVAGQFTITSISKLTLNKATAYRINFSLARTATAKMTQLIDAKVVKESHYRQDYLILGQNPLLIDQDYNASYQLDEYERQLCSLWATNHFSHDNGTFCLPSQTTSIYDPYVTRAVLKLMPLNANPLLRKAREYNCDDHRIPQYTDVFTMIMNREAFMIHNCFTRFQILETRALTTQVYQNTIRHSGIKAIVVPSQVNKDADNYTKLADIEPFLLGSLDLTGFRADSEEQLTSDGQEPDPCFADPTIPCNIETSLYGNSLNVIDKEELEGMAEYGVVGDVGMDIPVTGGSTYVLSEAFYKRELEACTTFERLLWILLDRKPVSYQDVYQFCDAYPYWGRLEQFYLGPLLLCLIRAAKRSL